MEHLRPEHHLTNSVSYNKAERFYVQKQIHTDIKKKIKKNIHLKKRGVNKLLSDEKKNPKIIRSNAFGHYY